MIGIAAIARYFLLSQKRLNVISAPKEVKTECWIVLFIFSVDRAWCRIAGL